MNLFHNIIIISSIVFTTVSLAISGADANYNVKVSNVTFTSVKLSWSSYPADTDAPRRSFVISYKIKSPEEDAAVSRSPNIIHGVNTTYHTIQSLSPSIQYEFTVSPAAVEGSTEVGPPLAPAVVATTRHVECMGTNMKIESPLNQSLHYQSLRDRYTNCTYVNGNLELTWLQDEDFDFSFLHHIREVAGYALIAYVNISKIVLPRLNIIWGRTRYKYNTGFFIQEFSLFIASSSIQNIELPSLRDIMAGGVGFTNDINLCYFYTINWDDIINTDGNKWKCNLLSGTTKSCPPCDESCTVKSCWGTGLHNCQKLSKVNCSHECNQRRCFEPRPGGCCHPFCAGGCTGPKQSDCLSCLYAYKDGICIGEYPTRNRFTLNFSANNDRMTPKLLYYAVVIIVSLNIVGVLLMTWHGRKRIRVKKKAINMVMELTGIEDNPPLKLSNVPPNTAKLRIIKEVDLRISAELGNGAFGVVYRGIWIVEGKTIKIPVAIKKLHKLNEPHDNENASKEFLDEAYLMARVKHENLVKLLAVCMTSEPILVTELMPLGCLLNYVRNNKNKIGSISFIKWSTQIAKGMAYLEENRLVHRDLAARNVLVQNVSNVKISDFGLAKLLDVDQLEYIVGGGKMPVKWLAPECLKYGVFTHKSDVWAFGVTVWELLTYGEQPYGNVEKKEMPSLLERGERLPQPPICTIDVYMVMVKCWLIEKDSRPSFEELADEFAKMAIDPGRYLVIPGDRYMRLPSDSSQDENEILSNLATEGADMSIMEADEYMNPKMGNSMPGPSRMGSSSTAGADMLGPMHSRHNWDRELRKFGDIHRIDCDTSDDLSDGSKAQVGTLKLDLPLDEDEYLMPSPANNEIDDKHRHSPANYINLIGRQHTEAEYANIILPRSPGLTKKFHPDVLATQVSSIDNPEYHLTGGNSSIVASVVTSACENSDAASAEPQLPVPTLNGRSPEDESDHEFYNDFDRLQRELQPLRRN